MCQRHELAAGSLIKVSQLQWAEKRNIQFCIMIRKREAHTAPTIKEITYVIFDTLIMHRQCTAGGNATRFNRQ